MQFGRAPAPMRYHAMRLRWCRQALLAFLRRWAVYLLVVSAAIGGGVSSAVEIVLSASAWAVLPLFRAAVQPPWLLPAVLLQAAAGTLLVWGLRPLLWPMHWAEAERALPITSQETRRSDLVVVTLALLPLMLLYAVGTATLLAHDPAWLRPARTTGVVALVVSTLAAIAAGVALLQLLRRPRGRRSLMPRPRHAQATSRHRPASTARAGWVRALLWWPLWRGPAQRTGHALLLGSTALCLPAAGMWARSGAAGWWLAAFSALALAAVTRVNALAVHEFAALREASIVLPLQPRSLARGIAAMALAPLAPGLILMLAALPASGVRPAVLGAWVAVCAGIFVVEVASQPADAAAKSSRWLFSLVLALALASEVVA